ncbi:MAG: preprotein translocase subunit SecG [Gemmatimonadetes bacterium 13_1_40CM_70_11]|nr:MAG: preprotein translocase subunit SecG [Gemmatimonadetes bacterium 13_1_40CM_70_11]
MFTLLKFILLLDALILTIAVLLQAGQGGGLASLGGGSGTEMFMGGRQATTLLHKVSWWTAGIFMFLALILAVMSAHSGAPRSVLEGATPPPAPVQSAPLPIQSSTPAPQPQTKTPSHR